MSMEIAIDFDPRAYPTITEAARMLDVSKSTISRRAQERLPARGVQRVPAREVLRLAREQRTVPVTQVAAQLISYAAANAPSSRAAVEREVEESFVTDHERSEARVSREAFLQQARELLDEPAYVELERRYDEAYGRRPKTHLVSAYTGVDA